MVGSIVVVGVLAHNVLLHAMCHLKAVAQMNMQHSSIWELMLHKFKLGHKAMESTKNICCAKSEGTVGTMVEKISLGLLQDPQQSGKVR